MKQQIESENESPSAGRRESLKIDLTLALVKRLRRQERPVAVDADGNLMFEPNPALEPYIVWDSSRGAPPGFGLKVAGRKTSLVQRGMSLESGARFH